MKNKTNETLNISEKGTERYSSINKISMRFKSAKYPRKKNSNDCISRLLLYIDTFKAEHKISKDDVDEFLEYYKQFVEEIFKCDFYDNCIPLNYVKIFDKMTEDLTELANQTEHQYFIILLGWVSSTRDYLHKNKNILSA